MVRRLHPVCAFHFRVRQHHCSGFARAPAATPGGTSEWRARDIILHGISGLLLAGALAACSSFRGAPPPPVDATTEVQGLANLYDASAIRACLEIAVSRQKDCRDQIVQARMVATDAQYREFRQWFYGEARWGGFAATVASLALTGTATLAGISQATARALSAAATVVTGTRAAYDKEILADRAANAIETSMDAARAVVGVRIRSGLTLPPDKYPLAEALSDLEDYYSAGTLLGAFTNISTLTGVQAASAGQQLATLARGGTLTTAPSRQRITNWLRPNGTLDPARRAQLQNWLKTDVIDAGAAELPWAQIFVDPPGGSREDMRQRAINDLKIP